MAKLDSENEMFTKSEWGQHKMKLTKDFEELKKLNKDNEELQNLHSMFIEYINKS